MKRAVLSVLISLLLCCSALAAGPWETGRLPYRRNLKGSVCWTGMRIYHEGRKAEPVFHSMDLSTGKISTRELGDWYLIQTDLRKNGTLIARHDGSTLQIAQYGDDGKWTPFLEYPVEADYTHWDTATAMNYTRPVIACQGGYLYYMMSDGEAEWVRRDDMKGHVRDYAHGFQGTVISPGGSLWGTDGDENKVVETAAGDVYIIGRNDEKNRSYFPIAWLNDERLLMWVRELDQNWDEYLYSYNFRSDSFTPVCDKKGKHILSTEGCSGFTSSLNPANGQIVQLIFWAEDFYCVPTVLDPSSGLPVFIAETEHTDKFDEHCTSSDRVSWLLPG